MKKIIIAVLVCTILNNKISTGQSPSIILPIGHFENVTDANYSPDGMKISTTSQDRTVKIWNPQNGRLLLTLSDFGVMDIVSRVLFSPDGRTLMTINELGQVKVWDSANGKLLMQPNPGQTGTPDKSLRNFRYSPDSKFIYMNTDSVLKIFDIKNATLFRTLRSNNASIVSFDFNHDKKTLLTTSDDGSASIWDVKTSNLLKTIKKEDSGTDLSYASFSADGKNIIASSSGVVNIIEPATGMLVITLDNIMSEGVAFSSDGSKILAVAHLIFNEGRWKKLSDVKRSFFEDAGPEGFLPALFSRDGKLLKAYIDSSTINLQEGFTGSHEHKGNFICFSPDDKSVLQYWDKLRIWDTENSRLLMSRDLPGNFVNLCYTPDNKRIFVTNTSSVDLYDAGSFTLVNSFEGPVIKYQDSDAGSYKLVPSAGLSPDGRHFFIVPLNSGSVKIIDSSTGKISMDLVGNSIPVSSVNISEDGNLLMSKTTGKINSARIWDLNQGRLLSSFESEASFSDSGRTVVTLVPGRSSAIIYHWNSARGEKTDSVTVKADSVVKCYYSPDGSSLVAVNNEYEAILVNAATGESISPLRGPVTNAVYSPDSKLIATSSWFSFLNLWDAQTGKLTATLTRDNNDYTKETIGYQVQAIDSSENISVSITPETEFSQMSDREKNFVSGVPESMVQFSRDGKVITAIRGENSSTCLWDVFSGKLLYMSATNLNVNPDVTRAVLAGAYWEEGDSAVSRVIDLKTGNTQFLLDKLSYTRLFLGQEFSPDGKSILASYQDSAKLWDSENGNLKQSFHYSGRILGTDWKRNRIIVHDNSMLIFFDIITGKQLFTFIAIDLDDYLVVTPDNYYMGTKNAASKISWRAGSNLYRFDQFDLQYNRPDIVLKRMGNSDSSLIKLYHNAYEKRLKKSGFTENMFSPVWHTPTVEIINNDSLDFEPGKGTVTLRIRASDDLYRINSIVIRVNGVPENGTRGYSYAGQNRNDITNDFKVKLSQGENDITVSCFNEKGVESYRETLDIQNNTMVPAKPDLYFIGMSVSDYKDQRFNLGYAVKDGRDMAALFEETGMDSKNFSHVFIDTLFNRNAIKSKFLEMKKRLSGSNCDDQVVVFISGHGLLDKKLDFYYATWDMNFKKPESKGLSFDEMESILDGIPARRKLFMMDACHSGEMDKEEFTSDENNYQAKKEDVVFRGMLKEYRPKGDYSKTMSSGLNLDQSFELMQEMFAGLDQGTGTNVISAASGKGFALESPSWNNGVFTFSILNGLKKMAADFNNDKSVSVSELRKYAINRVQELTGGRQKPTSRRETLTFDWNIR